MTDASGPSPERRLRVLLADESVPALERLREVLERLGHEPTGFAVSVREAAQLIADEDPDIAFVMVHNDDDHALALIEEAVEYASGPVVAHIREADVGFVARAAERGIAAYVESASPRAVQGAIELALRRHRSQVDLAEKVAQLQTALDRRAVIERAKGVLMERYAIDETAAFQLMRDHARAGRRRVVDVASAVLGGDPLPPRD